jgi:archaellum component FlaC
MADDLNKKINIDVEVNTDGQQQITQYKEAFDNFRNSINSIKNPLNSISDDFKTLNKNVSDMAGSLNKLNSTAASFNSTGSKIGGMVNTAINSFVGLKIISKDLGIAFGEFTAEATGGLSLLISCKPAYHNLFT